MENDCGEFRTKNNSGELQMEQTVVGLTENEVENYSCWLPTENDNGELQRNKKGGVL